jgi:hypothetical protein
MRHNAFHGIQTEGRRSNPMNAIIAHTPRRLALVVVVALPFAAGAQAPQQAGTLTISGQPDQAALVRIDGKSYVDIESLARITHGSVRFQGNQTILTLPGIASGNAPATQASKPPQLSEGFLGTEIEALTQIREWRAALVNSVENNYPVTDSWVGKLRRSAEAKLQLAVAAATTEPDHQALALLQNEFTNMQAMSDQFLAMQAKVNYISPDSFDSNAQDQKILSCERALIVMAASKQFQDEPNCH